MTVALVAWWFEVCPTATAQNKLKSDKHTGIVFNVRFLVGDDSKAPLKRRRMHAADYWVVITARATHTHPTSGPAAPTMSPLLAA